MFIIIIILLIFIALGWLGYELHFIRKKKKEFAIKRSKREKLKQLLELETGQKKVSVSDDVRKGVENPSTSTSNESPGQQQQDDYGINSSWWDDTPVQHDTIKIDVSNTNEMVKGPTKKDTHEPGTDLVGEHHQNEGTLTAYSTAQEYNNSENHNETTHKDDNDVQTSHGGMGSEPSTHEMAKENSLEEHRPPPYDGYGEHGSIDDGFIQHIKTFESNLSALAKSASSDDIQGKDEPPTNQNDENTSAVHDRQEGDYGSDEDIYHTSSAPSIATDSSDNINDDSAIVTDNSDKPNESAFDSDAAIDEHIAHKIAKDFESASAVNIAPSSSERELAELLQVEQMIGNITEGAISSILTTPKVDMNVRVPTVLLIEDSISFRVRLENILKNGGCKVVTRSNGQDALDLLTKSDAAKFDIIISDIDMPKMDGYTLYNELQSRNKLKSIPFIIITATIENVTKAQNIGIKEALFKPFSEKDIEEAFRRQIPDFFNYN